MKQPNLLLLLLLLIALPGAAFALEQSFTQQGGKATIRLSPDILEPRTEVQFSLGLSKDGASLTDKDVTLSVYERNADHPIIERPVDVLDNEYVDAWEFEKAGDYRVVIKIADHQKPYEISQYEISASVIEATGDHGDHGFFSHHFSGGHWGWWGAGMMIIMMVPMMILL